MLSPTAFQKKLLHWFDYAGRHDLPWQQNKTPYRVWISEVMLQQTQVATVIPYFNRFINAFPSIESLAAAEEDDVLQLWTGLGYYSRARNCHRTAKKIVAEYQGKFPNTVAELQTLPGIGESTAGAICAIAFQKKATILDGNVKRVLIRLLGIQSFLSDKNTLLQLWGIAKKYTPVRRISDYTQAMMDLGATICTRGKPACAHCPFQTNCIAHQKGIESELPLTKPKKSLPVRHALFLILQHNQNKLLLQKRINHTIWKNLFCFPEMAGKPTCAAIQQFCQTTLGLTIDLPILEPAFRHSFTHFHLEITFALIPIRTIKTVGNTNFVWYNIERPQLKGGLPAPIKKRLEKLRESITLCPDK